MPAWAFLTVDTPPAKSVTDETPPLHVPGSDKSFTMPQIHASNATPDWFPAEHPPMPQIVEFGHAPDVRACTQCHGADGMGGPESASLAGLPANYIVRQFNSFITGQRINDTGMNYVLKATPEEIRAAAGYFASLKPVRQIKVIESDQAPKIKVMKGRQARRASDAVEPLGRRIVELPEDEERANNHDPHAGYVAYVPKGSVATGEALVKGVGKPRAVACTSCHGANLKGVGEVPYIAGRSPLYIARQLFDFQSGSRTGAQSALMKPVVAKLSEDDVIAIAAYLATRNP